jgi:hypothetical protein
MGMSRHHRLVALVVVVALALLGTLVSSRPATAIGGCFTFQNSTMTWIPDANDPLGGTPSCASTGSTCTECVSPGDDGGYFDCYASPDGDWDCREYGN